MVHFVQVTRRGTALMDTDTTTSTAATTAVSVLGL